LKFYDVAEKYEKSCNGLLFMLHKKAQSTTITTRCLFLLITITKLNNILQFNKDRLNSTNTRVITIRLSLSSQFMRNIFFIYTTSFTTALSVTANKN